MKEIKIYGTGGQGAVIAAKFLANAATKSGFHAQAFSTYGAQRRGGKVEGYVRFSTKPVVVHSKMYDPDYVIMMDEIFARDPQTLLDLKEGGGLLINSQHGPDTFSSLGNFKIVTVNARRIATKNGVLLPSGVPVINTTILGAFLGMLPEIDLYSLLETIKEGKIPAADKNINAAREAYELVFSEVVAEDISVEEPEKITSKKHPVYRDKTAPCEVACPAGHAVHKTLSLIREDRFEEALSNIRAENPFPGITGRVCFHPCEAHCNAREHDQPVSIHALERAVSDHAHPEMEKWLVPREDTGKRVAIIGSGPSGLTCAHFLNILGHHVTLYEALPKAGGIPRVGIPAYRLPEEVVNREVQRIIDLGIDLKTNTVVGKDVLFEDILENYDACFLGVGAQGSLKLNIPGEESEGVLSGLKFLKKIALGQKVLLGNKVAVIGGGNTAVDAARSAKRLGAQEITLVYRRSEREMPAHDEEREAAEKEGVKMQVLSVPIGIHRDGTRLDKLECLKTRLGAPDSDGRCRPVPVEDSNFMLIVDNVITAIGETLEIPFLPDTVAMNGSLIQVDGLGRTSIPGLFAGGDATNHLWNVTEAIGSGKRAAIGMDIFLHGQDGKGIAQDLRGISHGSISMAGYLDGKGFTKQGGSVSFSDLNTAYFSGRPRARSREQHISHLPLDFGEVKQGLSRSEAMKEANRCFHCGHCNLCGNCYLFCPDTAIILDENTFSLVIREELCKGCGICIHECPRDAIAWEGEGK
ncbi:MAG: 2-oxoacid:acceptor oxidoreductase family protein [Desulfobacteraceae bacterium]|nr:2-oxoacid:acceptor oxidoreductase family protein [Desulfobacteraceae bacterium]